MMNCERTEWTRQALPTRRQFLSRLGNTAGVACAVGLPLRACGAESTSAPPKRVLLEVLKAAGKPARVVTAPDGSEVVVRNFVVNPSGEYVDVPWDDPSDLSYSTQACNVNSRLGQFAELEYHIPAIGGSTGRMRCDDAAQVWAFRGPEQSILDITRRLVAGDRFALQPH